MILLLRTWNLVATATIHFLPAVLPLVNQDVKKERSGRISNGLVTAFPLKKANDR